MVHRSATRRCHFQGPTSALGRPKPPRKSGPRATHTSTLRQFPVLARRSISTAQSRPVVPHSSMTKPPGAPCLLPCQVPRRLRANQFISTARVVQAPSNHRAAAVPSRLQETLDEAAAVTERVATRAGALRSRSSASRWPGPHRPRLSPCVVHTLCKDRELLAETLDTSFRRGVLLRVTDSTCRQWPEPPSVRFIRSYRRSSPASGLSGDNRVLFFVSVCTRRLLFWMRDPGELPLPTVTTLCCPSRWYCPPRALDHWLPASAAPAASIKATMHHARECLKCDTARSPVVRHSSTTSVPRTPPCATSLPALHARFSTFPRSHPPLWGRPANHSLP